uniref:Uncharacterized protein n=1 Tax=Phaeomonas parva TaxID=124430 RepID=A0A7S1XMS6_9STRA|mmetsp:Transcript_20981/g.63924  ORF Transcript_20981/g.63924 Transcript_20981/m.63924 type:complete len:357 (+) Transcript_20981:583-1653(+)
MHPSRWAEESVAAAAAMTAATSQKARAVTRPTAMDEAVAARAERVGGMCTVIITTSPTPSNPACTLIEAVIESMVQHAPELCGCRCIIVCDGYKIRENGLIKKSKFRSGEILRKDASAYEAYKAALEARCGTATCGWRRAEVLHLPERRGFGYAVKAALETVRTPFICVLQHDRTFIRDFRHTLDLLSAMQTEGRLKMVGLPTQSNDPRKYVHSARSKLGDLNVGDTDVLGRIVRSHASPALRYLPLLRWHDSTHFASSSYYRDFVFGPRNLVSRGGFIEDKLGQQQIKDLRNHGWSSHGDYGTYLLDDGATQLTYMVAHLDGKKFSRREDRHGKGRYISYHRLSSSSPQQRKSEP